MAQFHTDEYVDFLSRITPDNMDAYGREQAKCAWLILYAEKSADEFAVAQSMLETTVLFLMVCSSTAPFQLVVQWVSRKCYLSFK